MMNEREYLQEPGPGSADNQDRNREEQFNELSELSLEERMAVADQIGVPVRNAGEASALGTASGPDDAAADPDGRVQEDRMDEPEDL